jgi:prepilin-type N-terminal cleavage/methylation domain-containing protein
MKKIKAFTLSELLVVLIISSIVISLTFVIFGLVQKHVKAIQENFKFQQERQLFERTLLNDLNTSTSHLKTRDILLFYKFNDTILYNFNNDFILRNRDTFHLKKTGKTTLLENKLVREGPIDAIKIVFNKSFGNNVIFVFKTNDAAHYMNN